MNIKEAIKIHNAVTGKKLTQTDIAMVIWPDSDINVARVNMYRLTSGKRVFVSMSWIKIISDMTGVDSNYILGFASKNYNKYESILSNIR